MTVPPPQTGMVIRYGYVWHSEAMQGREDARKVRPCIIVRVREDGSVLVSPITHTPPAEDVTAREVPQQIARTCGLDQKRNWIVTNEVNEFQWPSSHVRSASNRKWELGHLTPGMKKAVLQEVLGARDRERLKTVDRSAAKTPAPSWLKTSSRSAEGDDRDLGGENGRKDEPER